MNEPAQPVTKPEPVVGLTVGPFVFLGDGVWVNAQHVSSVAGTSNPNKCWVTTLSTGTDDDASYALDQPPQDVIDHLVGALSDWEMTKGEQQERGRLECLSEVQ